MKRILLVTGLALSVMACQSSKKKEKATDKTEEVATTTSEPKLVKLWETDTVLKTCESVLFDGEQNRLFVSNINRQKEDQPGNGFISILNLDGSIAQLEWATGLNAPKGMGILNGQLYVTDVDRIVAIDLKTGKIAKEYKPEKADFLNDITISDSAVYASDMNLGTILKIQDGKLNTIAKDVTKVNGLLIDGDQLMTLDAMGLRSFDLATQQFEMVNDSVTGGDGLVKLDAENYIASRWKGEIYLVSGNETQLLLDTQKEESQTADIGLNANEKILYVPTFYKNKVVAYQLEN